MGIPERFAGIPDGSQWRAELANQAKYFDLLRERLDVWAAQHRPACSRTWFCILKPGHPDDCLAITILTNIPPDPSLPPERRAPGTTA